MKWKNDRQSQRTRQALGAALLQLMKEKGYRAVSIKDIIDRANVGRSTFYAHFADKDELFENQVNRMLETLIEHTPQDVLEGNPYFPSLELFRHVQEQWKLYKLLSWEAGNNLHINHLQKTISQQIEQRLSTVGKTFEFPIPILANFLAGSLLSLLKWWLDNKMTYSPEQMDEMFRKLALPGTNQVTNIG
ncbi:MAG TPA: TetR/AcrR family transcriptional regulator [Anaerolineales bacterium]|nr:TetR/AcrR family transcriptional regulator [Anaerolineales bacterium]